MVGGADFMVQDQSGGVSDAVIGDIIVVCAQVEKRRGGENQSNNILKHQVIAACQFVYEEKFIAKYNVHPLKVVESEGIFGFIALILIQVQKSK